MLSSTKHLEYTATLWKSLCLFLYNFFPVDSIDTEVQYTKLSHQRTGDRITRSCMWKNECIQLHTWCAPSFSLPNPSHIFRRIRRDEKKKIISYLPPAACLTLSLITRHFNAWDIFNMNCTRIHRKYAYCLSFSLALFLLFFFFNRFSFSQSIGITIRKLIYLFVLIRPLIKATNRIVIFVFTSSFSVINVCFSI